MCRCCVVFGISSRLDVCCSPCVRLLIDRELLFCIEYDSVFGVHVLMVFQGRGYSFFFCIWIVWILVERCPVLCSHNNQTSSPRRVISPLSEFRRVLCSPQNSGNSSSSNDQSTTTAPRAYLRTWRMQINTSPKRERPQIAHRHTIFLC